MRTGERPNGTLQLDVENGLKNITLMPEIRPDTSRPPLTMDGPYTQDRALEDFPGVKYALDLFLAGHMVESEEFCHESDPQKCVLLYSDASEIP